MDEPALVLKLVSKPITRVEVGFHDKKVYVFAQYRDIVVEKGRKLEMCSVEKVVVRAGGDWVVLDNESDD